VSETHVEGPTLVVSVSVLEEVEVVDIRVVEDVVDRVEDVSNG